MKTKTEKWIENVNNGMFKSKVEQVLWAVKKYQSETGKNIDTWYLRNFYKGKIPHQTLTGLLTQLHDEGIINVVGEVEVEGNIYSQYQFVSDETDRWLLRKERKREKYKLWLKRAEEFEELFEHHATIHHINYEIRMLKYRMEECGY